MAEQPTDRIDSGDREPVVGDPIPESFPPDDPRARFVVSMSMAKNDIERALRDLATAIEEDKPDFSYRVRLLIGHLVEAIAALNHYRKAFPEIRALLRRLPGDSQRRLKIVNGTLQRAGPGVLDRARDNTFHYPSPDSNHKPTTSDGQLADVLAAMTDTPADIRYNRETGEITLTFADQVALELATGRRDTSDELAQRQAEIVRDSALAFVLWEYALVRAYMDAEGHYFGEAAVLR